MKAYWLLLGLLLAGCASDSGNKDTQGPFSSPSSAERFKKDLKIAMIAKSQNNPVFQSAKTGAEAAAKELGEEHGLTITIDWQTPPEENGEEQARRIAQAVNEDADVILISCSDANKVTRAIDEAVAKGVPVMTFDSDAPQSKRFAFYGTDDLECGQQVMDELAKLTGGSGNYAILAGNQNAPNLQKRVQGVQEAAKKYPGMKYVDTVYHVETPQDATSAVMREMNAKPQIDSWAFVGGWPLFATGLLKLDSSKVRIVSVDALPAELPYVERGITPVLLAQPVYEWGHKSVQLIVDKLVLNKDVPEINKMQLVRVTKDNLSEWAQQLEDWGFEVDPKYLQR